MWREVTRACRGFFLFWRVAGFDDSCNREIVELADFRTNEAISSFTSSALLSLSLSRLRPTCNLSVIRFPPSPPSGELLKGCRDGSRSHQDCEKVFSPSH
ncbi:hypothetical protein Nepgr_009711 [Nepenthes gracilis]|uniref:Uncharacterized protein n=1 Tax=Nepenthes gracilis TaxID=150966 RepID=A0AAD3SBM4_NEPGR|nr:hypothetical protein Nepgr_009711 [Nepenthes gracilis]